MADVRVESISKKFRSITALDDVSFEMLDGEFFVLLGPTGAGKTTTLRVIAGLEKQDAGHVYFDGIAVGRACRRPSAMLPLSSSSTRSIRP